MKKIILLLCPLLAMSLSCEQPSGASAETDLETEQQEKTGTATSATGQGSVTAQAAPATPSGISTSISLEQKQLVGRWLKPEGPDDKPSGFEFLANGNMVYINEPGRKGLRFEVKKDSLILHYRFDGYKKNSKATWIIKEYNDSSLTLRAIEAPDYRVTYFKK